MALRGQEQTKYNINYEAVWTVETVTASLAPPPASYHQDDRGEQLPHHHPPLQSGEVGGTVGGAGAALRGQTLTRIGHKI